ncbi:MAG TPA: hypothetical protein PK079_02890 [Leptospiraceae bacterium]|nr:hypothetical protein [Leptospiraceae bacterium]HMW04463.1 hypothetical protein [Leptospiraceae bacterium]HMX31121.1 hypothetical protein [Leptospiraceae bacterium]HMY30649.1 hypothetical protein [Leptospiraceae bacterium]HMZ65818.1 hypothetical protein [Leptospiraceae bacterium]
MISEIESEILITAMKFVQMDDEFVLDTSANISSKPNKILSWFDVYSKNSMISEQIHQDWVQKNLEPISLTPLLNRINVKFLPYDKFSINMNMKDQAWSVFFTITRPGISSDRRNALLKVTANCLSGPPNYASLLYLERSVHFWNVKSTHGLYNQ